MGEILIGLLLILLCLIIYFNSGDFPQINETHLDAGSYPKLIASLLILLALILVVKNLIIWLKNRSKRSNIKTKDYLKKQWMEYKIVVITSVFLALYVFLMNIIGFIFSTIAFIIATGLLIGARKKKDVFVISLVSLVITVGLYFFFENALHVRFPDGILF